MDEMTLEKKLFQYLQIVLNYLIKMGATREDAEDIIQNTAYKFIKYMDVIQPNTIKSWLFRVAINEYYDLCRKQKRRKEHILSIDMEQLSKGITAEEEVLQRETGKEITETLQKVSSKHREFLILKYSTGLTIQEIAEMYGMQPDSVKTTLYRARKQFISKFRRQI
ncbi:MULTISPECIES: RNA polymerase sigma factor [Sporosarcina]|uniref:RNA polymerase sigma factor n=1 Tax=Sporosarcina contaminans TaxID=633403 RepID=A0ABW3TU63_9BACL